MEVERVQAIASSVTGLDTIPADFIRSEDEQPGFTTFSGPVPEIPVVDLGGDDEEKVASAVVAAATEWGIFQVVNHGIPVEALRELRRVGREFFELPQEEKEKYAMKDGKLEGYGTKLQKEGQGKKAWVDFLFHNVWPPASINYAFWPENPPEYRSLAFLSRNLPHLSLSLYLHTHLWNENSIRTAYINFYRHGISNFHKFLPYLFITRPETQISPLTTATLPPQTTMPLPTSTTLPTYTKQSQLLNMDGGSSLGIGGGVRVGDGVRRRRCRRNAWRMIRGDGFSRRGYATI